MDETRRKVREVAEDIVKMVLKNIQKKIDVFEIAKEDNDRDGMLDSQLTPEEWSFVQAQQTLKDNQPIEAEQTASLLSDMDNKDLQELLEKVRPTIN